MKKLLTWKIKTPGASCNCPWCGKQLYVGVEVPVQTNRCKVWMCKKKEVGKNGSGKESDGTGDDDVPVPEV